MRRSGHPAEKTRNYFSPALFSSYIYIFVFFFSLSSSLSSFTLFFPYSSYFYFALFVGYAVDCITSRVSVLAL